MPQPCKFSCSTAALPTNCFDSLHIDLLFLLTMMVLAKFLTLFPPLLQIYWGLFLQLLLYGILNILVSLLTRFYTNDIMGYKMAVIYLHRHVHLSCTNNRKHGCINRKHGFLLKLSVYSTDLSNFPQQYYWESSSKTGWTSC